jgi:hypothetical protein
MSILLNDILNLSNLANVKIRFNTKNDTGHDPILFFKENNQRLLDGQFWNYKGKKSFQQGDIAIGFIRIQGDKWLLFDISLVTKDLNQLNAVGYEYQQLTEYKKYFGRLVIDFHNVSQNLIRKAEGVINECKVSQILADVFDNDIFPGYENVNLSWQELKRVVGKDSWQTALKNQKSVYLITDKNNGKMYVGSASGQNMLLGRWLEYLDNGHGGNKQLKELAFEYIQQNFIYSILEIYKSTTDDNIILERESWWKNTLLTRVFGYNDN